MHIKRKERKKEILTAKIKLCFIFISIEKLMQKVWPGNSITSNVRRGGSGGGGGGGEFPWVEVVQLQRIIKKQLATATGTGAFFPVLGHFNNNGKNHFKDIQMQNETRSI